MQSMVFLDHATGLVFLLLSNQRLLECLYGIYIILVLPKLEDWYYIILFFQGRIVGRFFFYGTIKQAFTLHLSLG